jgi:hypothetical protein
MSRAVKRLRRVSAAEAEEEEREEEEEEEPAAAAAASAWACSELLPSASCSTWPQASEELTQRESSS